MAPIALRSRRAAGTGGLPSHPLWPKGKLSGSRQANGPPRPVACQRLPPCFNWVGSHQFTLGMDLSYSRYSQHVQRTGYEYYRVDGSRAYSVSFRGNGKSSKSNLESAAYLQDRWAIRPWLLAEAGIRWDKDRVVSGQIFTPRFSFSVVPPRLERRSQPALGSSQRRLIFGCLRGIWISIRSRPVRQRWKDHCG